MDKGLPRCTSQDGEGPSAGCKDGTTGVSEVFVHDLKVHRGEHVPWYVCRPRITDVIGWGFWDVVVRSREPNSFD